MGDGVCEEAHKKYNVPDCQVCNVRDKIKDCYIERKEQHINNIRLTHIKRN